MAWYAYCITEQQTLANGTRSRRPSLLEGVQGVNGATVLTYPSGEFNIVVSEYERDNVQFGEKNVLEHARVVSVCFRSGTVLPFRFGTIFDTDDALRHAVRSNRRAFGQSASLHRAFLHYAHGFFVQTARTAMANGRSKIEERLARWLLMAHDRTDGDELALTHEFLATMLGVRRPGVTVALNLLEGGGFIRANRGVIFIVDREGLVAHSNGAYGAPEAEFQHLFG